VGDHEEGDADAALEGFEFDADFLAEVGIEGTEGFVEEEDGGGESEGAGEGSALFFAAGELGRETVFFAGELDEVEDFGDFLVETGDAFAFEAELDVLTDGEVGEEGVVLKDGGDVALVGREGCDVVAFEEDAAGGGDFKAGDHAEGGSFAAAGGANEGVEFAGGDAEVDVVDGAVGGEDFGDAGER
jgi:hypothetical protein